MEIQIPLILFTSLMAWSVGIFGSQCVLAYQGRAGKIQMTCLITSFIIMVLGGIAVFTHLQHWERIFNGFGHITSGITQELIGIVFLFIMMVVFFLMLRRSAENAVPKWVSILGLVACVVMLIAMGLSYMMASRPAWNNALQLLSLVGAAFVMGPATVALIAAVRHEDVEGLGLQAFIGAVVNAVCVLGFMLMMQMSSFGSFQYYFDPTHPNKALVSGSDISLLSGSAAPMLVIAVIGLLVALVAGYMAWKKKASLSATAGIALLGGLACAVALRTLMYVMGASVFMLY